MTREEVAAALRSAGESLITAAGYFSGETTNPPSDGEKASATPTAEKKDVIRLEDVRAVLSDISRSGHTAEMKELLAKHGAKKLSEVPEADYAALIAEAKEVRNA